MDDMDYSFSLIFEQLPVLAVAFALQLVERNEAERVRVDAIAQPAFVTGTIVENVA